MENNNISKFSSAEINEFTEFLLNNKENLPSRIDEVIFYGVCASQLAHVCKDHFSGKVSNKEAFDIIENSACMLIDQSIMKDLKTYIQVASVSLRSGAANKIVRDLSEKSYQKELIKTFDNAFPDFKFVASEAATNDKDRDRIDILAMCKNTGRDVIIELKLGKRSAHKQLRSYAYGFKDPILINISETLPTHTRDNITYLTYEMIGVKLN